MTDLIRQRTDPPARGWHARRRASGEERNERDERTERARAPQWSEGSE